MYERISWKQLIGTGILFAFISAWALASIHGPHRAHKDVKLWMFQPSVLMAVYNDTNNDWFDGKLPLDTLISEDLNDDSKAALTTEYVPGHFLIQFNPRYNQSTAQLQMYMFHEACHIPDIDGTKDHTKKFQSCMLRLANAGAFADLW